MQGKRLLAVGIAVTLAVLVAPDQPETPKTEFGPKFEPLCQGGETAWSIGQRYLELYPEKRNIVVLRRSSIGSTPLPESSESFEQRIQQQFAAGTTVVVDGWVISEAEASLCALVVLSEGQPNDSI